MTLHLRGRASKFPTDCHSGFGFKEGGCRVYGLAFFPQLLFTLLQFKNFQCMPGSCARGRSETCHTPHLRRAMGRLCIASVHLILNHRRRLKRKALPDTIPCQPLFPKPQGSRFSFALRRTVNHLGSPTKPQRHAGAHLNNRRRPKHVPGIQIASTPKPQL